MESDLGKLFIGGISWDTDEERLKEYFSQYGEVVEAVIMRDRATGRARGFGFIVFSDPSVAERVIMDKHLIDGRTVEAKKAVPKDDQPMIKRNASTILNSPGRRPTKKIFVGGLPSSITETDFRNYFDQFGTIMDAVVMYDHNTQRPRGFGFITYDSEEAVDRALHKTFHDLNGKMVEVKRAVPKELSPGPIRTSPFLAYNNYGLSRPNALLNNLGQGYNMSAVGGYGLRMDPRFSPLGTGRSAYSAFGNTGYGLGMNVEPGLNPGYSGGTTFGNSPGYTRALNPYLNATATSPSRYITPIGYNSSRNNTSFNSSTRGLWGDGGLSNAANLSPIGTNLGFSLGNAAAGWDLSSASGQAGGTGQGYNAPGGLNYDNGDNSYGFGGVGYGRNTETGGGGSMSSFSGSAGSIGEFYRSGSVYGGSTWQPSAPELDAPGRSFGFELGNVSSDGLSKGSEGYVGGYSVSRQSNRGIAG